MPRDPLRFQYPVLPALLLLLGACAPAGRQAAALGPMSAEECAREAQGISRDGGSASESFDSSFARAQRREPPPPPGPDAPRLDRAPAIANGAAIQSAMARLYPPELLFTRRGGSTMMAVLVRADGWPDKVRVLHSSGMPALDAASVEVARQLRFSPGVYRGCPVWVFSVMPINWEPGPPPAPGRRSAP